MNGTNQWRGAARHPARTTLLLFIACGVGTGLILQYAPGGGGNPVWAILGGLAAGSVVARQTWLDMRRAGSGLSLEIRFPVFLVAAGAGGLALIVWGSVVGDWGLGLAGLPLVALALALLGAFLVARHRQQR